MDVPRPDLVERRREIEQQLAVLEADLPNQFSAEPEIEWQTPQAELVSAAGANVEPQADGSLRLSGNNPERDTYTITFDADPTAVGRLRIEALVDPGLPGTGPGAPRTATSCSAK